MGEGVTVYVDNFRASFGRMKMCHMMADTMDELHAMAECLDLSRGWCHGDHYDISLTKRRLALQHGAVEATSRQLVDLRRKHRTSGQVP